MDATINAYVESTAEPWTVETLADGVAMSRSAFAQKFTSSVGEPPLSYLTRWRMQKARQMLRRADSTIAMIAHTVGSRRRPRSQRHSSGRSASRRGNTGHRSRPERSRQGQPARRRPAPRRCPPGCGRRRGPRGPVGDHRPSRLPPRPRPPRPQPMPFSSAASWPTRLAKRKLS